MPTDDAQSLGLDIVAAAILIGDGGAGTETDPLAVSGGLWFGDGGAGWTATRPLMLAAPAALPIDGNGGAGGEGFDGTAGGAGGDAGYGIGGEGGEGRDAATAGGEGGEGGAGGDTDRFLLRQGG